MQPNMKSRSRIQRSNGIFKGSDCSIRIKIPKHDPVVAQIKEDLLSPSITIVNAIDDNLYKQDNFHNQQEDPIAWSLVDFSRGPGTREKFLAKLRRFIHWLIGKIEESNAQATVIHENIERQKEEHFRRNWYWTR